LPFPLGARQLLLEEPLLRTKTTANTIRKEMP
jgi:hypothetical protein